MKTFSFVGGRVVPGIETKNDARFGPIVFLGEEGRGRQFEKIGLDRHDPADVIEGRVLECVPKTIPIASPRPGGPDKFPVLGKSGGKPDDQRILVRVNTCGCYTKNTSGSWRVIRGDPLVLVKGYGAEGLAGRCGSWDDGLIVMSPGDILHVKRHGGYKTPPHALVCGPNGLEAVDWADYEQLSQVEGAANTAEAI